MHAMLSSVPLQSEYTTSNPLVEMQEIQHADLENKDEDINDASLEYDITLQQQPKKLRNLSAFWFLGLCNNYAYVIMLSAAYDILNKDYLGNGTQVNSVPSNASRDCNPTSTGAILLADVIPSLLIKMIAPFFISNVHLRVLLVVMLCAGSFLLVALSVTEWMALLGVICAALCGGLGEVTFLSYTAFFNRNVISAWSSGTGGSGLLGAISYAALTNAGITPRNTLFIMLFIPLMMAVSFWILLEHPVTNKRKKDTRLDKTPLLSKNFESSSFLKLQDKVRLIPGLVKYMLPLGVVYLFEYFINQGLYELVYFRGIWLDHQEQYRWLQVDYQLGVFISRSSVNVIKIKRVWVLAVLQCVNAVFFTVEALYLFIPSIWIVFTLVLWEGLLGGAAYVNTFYKISQEVSQDKKEFSMGITSMADGCGIALAGGIALPTHDALCALPVH